MYYLTQNKVYFHRKVLYRKTIAVHCEKHMEHTNKLCVHKAEIVGINLAVRTHVLITRL